MKYTHVGIFSLTAQASLAKHSLSRCNYDLYGMKLMLENVHESDPEANGISPKISEVVKCFD